MDINELKESIHPIIRNCDKMDDLAFALAGCSFIDVCLSELLLRAFKKSNTANTLLSHKGALGTIFAKAQIAYCLNFLDKPVFQTILKIADIRNAFAHIHPPKSFSDHEIKALCMELNIQVYADDRAQESTDLILVSSKWRFALVILTLSNQIAPKT